MSVPLGGGTPTTLVASQGASSYLAVNATTICWTGNSGVMKAPIGGGTPTLLAPVPNFAPYGIAVDATSAYWTDYSGQRLMKVSIGGGTPVTLATLGSMPTGIAVDATNIYWLDADLMKVPIGGGSLTIVAMGQGGLALAVGGSNIIWSDYGTVTTCAIGSCTPVALATGLGSFVDAVASDGVNAYWATQGTSAKNYLDATLMKCAIGGCGGTPLLLASGPVGGIAVDATSVYWTNTKDKVLKTPK